MNIALKAAILVVIMMLTISQVAAQPNFKTGYSQIANQSSATHITEQKAVAIALQNFSGRVLAINHLEDAFRVKMLSRHGTVHIIMINAADGVIISSH